MEYKKMGWGSDIFGFKDFFELFLRDEPFLANILVVQFF